MVSCIQHKNHLTSTKIILQTRIRIFEAYVTSIFLYNSEVWTLTKALEKTIDVFLRNLLRKILDIRWSYTISYKDLYKCTKQEQWSQKIKSRRLRWLGHLMRLPTETPAQQALQEDLHPTKGPPGKPKTTWISRANEDLKEIDPKLYLGSQALQAIKQNRDQWRHMTKSKSAVQSNCGTRS